MSNSAILVAKLTAVATFERNDSDENISIGADYVPAAWFALFDKDDIVITTTPPSPPEESWRCLSLLTTKDKALSRLAERTDILLTIFPKPMEKYLAALTSVIKKTKGEHIQAILSDLDDQFAEENRAMLESFLQVIKSRDAQSWRDILGYFGCGLGKGLGDLEYDPETVVNALVGWVSGEPVPEPYVTEKPKTSVKKWWKFW